MRAALIAFPFAIAIALPCHLSAGWTGIETFNAASGTYESGQSFAGDKGTWSVTDGIAVSLQADTVACQSNTIAAFAIAQGATLVSPTFTGGIGLVTFRARGTVAAVRSLPSGTTIATSTDGQCRTYQLAFNVPGDDQIEFQMQAGGVVDDVTATNYGTATVTSTQPGGNQYVNGASTILLANFSAPVAGATAANFNLATTGDIAGASITNILHQPEFNQITVSIATGTGSGTIRLDVENGTGMSPVLTNVPYRSGFSVVIDKTVPQSTAFAEEVQTGDRISGTMTVSDTGSYIASQGINMQLAHGYFNAGAAFSGNDWYFLPFAAGVHDIASYAVDGAFNTEPAPAAGALGDVRVYFRFNESDPFPRNIFADGVFPFPIQTSPPLFAELQLAGVSGSGTVSIQRTVGNTAPDGFSAARQADFSLSITKPPALSFASATLVVEYEEADLGDVSEDQITQAIRSFPGGSEVLPATVDTAANTITVENVTDFSTWHFGRSDTDPESVWTIY